MNTGSLHRPAQPGLRQIAATTNSLPARHNHDSPSLRMPPTHSPPPARRAFRRRRPLFSPQATGTFTAISRHLTVAATALVAAILTTACSSHHAPPAEESLPTVSVQVATVEVADQVAQEHAVGTVRAKLRATVEAKVSGRISTMAATPGKTVQSGELLAELDAAEIAAKLDQARALFEQSEKDLARFQSLLERQAVTRAEYDAQEARHRVAIAAVQEAETMLSYTKITAPFDAVVVRKLADVGDLASPGRPLVQLENPDQLQLEASVPAALVDHLSLGLQTAIHIDGIDQDLPGTVAEMTPSADPISRTFLVKLDLPSTPGLRSGQFGRVAIPTAQRSMLHVPLSAVVRRGQMEMVFVVNNSKAAMRLVKTGKPAGDKIQLLSGISAGEIVVTQNAETLTDGQPVQANP